MGGWGRFRYTEFFAVIFLCTTVTTFSGGSLTTTTPPLEYNIFFIQIHILTWIICVGGYLLPICTCG